MTANGLGKDVWTLSFYQITDFLKVNSSLSGRNRIPMIANIYAAQYLYANEVLYFTELFSAKLCILVFYLRIFPGIIIRRLIWGTIVFNIICLVVFDFVTIFQCRPINFYWEGWDGLHEGACLSVNTLVWVNAAVSITTDLWMLGLPMSQLRNLQLHWKRKLGVALMFGVGFL